MKLAFVADVHVGLHRRMGGPTVSGLNRRCWQIVDTLKRVATRVKALGCENLIVLGDLFDTDRPEPQVIAAVQKALEEPSSIIVMGNHDQISTEDGDHTLGPLAPIASVFEKPAVVEMKGSELVVIPFQPGPAKIWLPKVMETLLGERPWKVPNRVLALHLGLASHDTAAFLKDAHDSIPAHVLGELCGEYGVHAVFAGNWHFHKVYLGATPLRTQMVQVGTLCPTGWDNPGMEGHGSLVIYDTEKNLFVREVIPGPRFLTVNSGQEQSPDWLEALARRSDHLKDQHKPLLPNGWELYLRIKATADTVAAGTARVAELIKDNVIVDGEVALDDLEMRVAARTAATVATSATTLDAALAGFIDQMPLEEGVDRGAVLAQAKRYLG